MLSINMNVSAQISCFQSNDMVNIHKYMKVKLCFKIVVIKIHLEGQGLRIYIVYNI